MFCPQCSTQNESEQKFCRQCGLPLTAVVNALEGRSHETPLKLKGGETVILTSGVLLSLLTLVALLTLVLGYLSNGVLYTGVLFLPFFALLGTLPLIFGGLVRLHRDNRLSEAESNSARPELELGEKREALPSASRTPIMMPGSVTEHTTRELSSYEPTKK
ncbi:MAG: zinc ribbon domain-containing protein [Rubrivivax sp.]|nr:zinc ribbon domain-containing protein [Pyrinomonadaceae bacterium]